MTVVIFMIAFLCNVIKKLLEVDKCYFGTQCRFAYQSSKPMMAIKMCLFH